MKSKVSIIIPVYNVERYLRQCMDSVVNQTLKEIEIICVNDGSTDNSLRILEEYAQKDNRIKIINKKNNGLGAARNTGMEYATGEYIGFVDSDDWIDITMYDKLYRNAKSQNSDMSMCPIHLFDDITKELKYDIPYFNLSYFDADFDDRVFNYMETKDFFFRISVTAWNKIYRTEFLNRNNIKFPENLIFEDNPFFIEAYLKTSNVSLIRDFLYFYRINRNNSIMLKAGKSYFDIIKIHNLLRDIFTKTNNFEEYKHDLLNEMVTSYFYRYSQVDEIYKKEFFELIKQDFEKKDLKANEIDELTNHNRTKYQNVINSNSYREFQLSEEISQLKSVNNKLKHQNQVYKTRMKKIKHQKEVYQAKVKEITSSNSWKLTKPLRMIGVKLKYLKKDLNSPVTEN